MSKPNRSSHQADHPIPRGDRRGFSHGRRTLAGKSIGGLVVIVLIGLYAFARPIVNEQLGWNLPELRQGPDGDVTVVDPETPSNSTATKPEPPATKPASSASTPARTSDAKPEGSANAKDPVADRTRPTSRGTLDSSKGRATNESSVADTRGDSDLLYGLLKDIGSERYVSPEGLLYTPGSAEGHRLEHLRRHTKDQPSRPGSHGVFDGDMAGALRTVDRAYERAKKGQRTTKMVDDGRTIYTVDMGGRVGYVGGRDGNRKRKPMARRVRLVLEGTRVITAYPM